MAKVYFVKGTNEDFMNGRGFDKVFAALKEVGLDGFSGKETLLKLHMGERGNEFYTKAPVIGHFVSGFIKAGLKPFLFDTCVRYPGSRHTKEDHLATAKEHGFGDLGCPVVIGNEGNTIEVDVNGNMLGFEVANELCEAEYVISLAHGKGHMMTGFGGAIKAFGMGGVSKEAKGFVHSAGAPVMNNEEDCRLCAACMEACPNGAIKVGEKWVIDYGKCGGCDKCVRACPSGVLVWKQEEFDRMLAAAARACLDEFGPKNKPKKKIYVNVLTEIAKYCDCMSGGGPAIAPDIGIVISSDPVAIDAASIDLIEKVADKSLDEIHDVDSRLHVKYGQELGMGETKYELVEL